jgi:hypothetical protein
MLIDMKKRILLMFTAFVFCTFFALAQNMPSGLTTAFKKGSAQDLAPFLGNQVVVIIRDNTQTFSKSETQKAMAGFFSANKVTGFTVNHQGDRNESGFIVGNLSTTNGSFRVNCFFKKSGNDSALIHQIRIVKTNE